MMLNPQFARMNRTFARMNRTFARMNRTSYFRKMALQAVSKVVGTIVSAASLACRTKGVGFHLVASLVRFCLIGKDESLRATFYAALRKPNGGDRKSQQAKDNIRIDIVNSDKVPSGGNSKAYALQKLSDEGNERKGSYPLCVSRSLLFICVQRLEVRLRANPRVRLPVRIF